MRERYGMHTFGQGLLLSRRLIEAGTRFVQVNWPSVANGNPEVDVLGHARRELRSAEESALPETRSRPLRAARRHGQRGMLKETLVVAIGEFGRSRRAWASARPATPTLPTAAITGPIATAPWSPAAASPAARSTAKVDQTASSPKDKPVHPNDLLATVYYALGIDPDMEVLNHLNQPRELVKGKVVADLWS